MMSHSVIQLKPMASQLLARPERAAQLSDAFADASTSEILRFVLSAEFPERIALVSSFGAESSVLLHLAARIDPAVPVVFLDTAKHFAQTLSYRKKLAAALGLVNIINITPAETDLAKNDPTGELWRTDTDACCNLRKVRPLASALDGYDAWITGRKQFHGGARIRLPVFEDSGTHLKVNPLVRWTSEEVTAYMGKHDLPQHPLVQQGFPSVGCWPCTHPVAEGDDVRAGRWRGKSKTECGIHL